MNRGRYQQDARVAKRVRKQVRQANPTAGQEELPRTTPRKTPLSKQRKDKSILASLHHQMALKKSRVRSKHSKRTTPGEPIDRLFAPAVEHRESTHWIKTVVKQSVTRAKRLARKLKRAFR